MVTAAANMSTARPPSGLIIERSEVFRVPTVERERVLFDSKNALYDRIPTADMAFRATI